MISDGKTCQIRDKSQFISETVRDGFMGLGLEAPRGQNESICLGLGSGSLGLEH